MAITIATVMTDLGKIFAAYANLGGMGGAQNSLGAYVFTTSAITTAPTPGATYTNNGVTFTVLQTMAAAGQLMVASGNSAPAASGTLTKASGTGDATVTFSAFARYSNWGTAGPVIKSQSAMLSDVLTRINGTGLTTLLGYNNWQDALLNIDSSLQSPKTAMQGLAQQVLIKRVNNDVSQQNSNDLKQAMTEFIRQMQSQSKSVNLCVLSATVTASGGNTGTATPVCTLIDKNGLTLEYSFPETLVLKCTQDAPHGATAGSETVTITSPASKDFLSYQWPGGSALSTTVTVVDPTQGYGSGGNIVGGGTTTVGAFKAWTGSIPNGWAIDVDGTNISDGTSSAYAGLSHCLKFAGNTGGTNLQTSTYQSFANGGITTGSSVTIAPETVYHFYAKVKADVVPAAGVISFSLTDGSGTVLNDNAGNANTITTTVSGYGGTTYQTVTGSFRTPTVMPTNVRLRVKATTPITTGSNVFIDYLAISEPATQGNNYGGLYPGGPYLSVFRGDVDLVNFVSPTIGDYWTIAIANDLGSSSPTPLSFQPLFWLLFNMPSMGLILPSAGSGGETEVDTLIS